jgi:hypothetical protein
MYAYTRFQEFFKGEIRKVASVLTFIPATSYLSVALEYSGENDIYTTLNFCYKHMVQFFFLQL